MYAKRSQKQNLQKLKADPNAMLEDLRQGLPLRKIGSKHHVCHRTVAHHLTKFKNYKRLIGNALRLRLKAATTSYAITPTCANSRAVKLARAILERERPHSARAFDERSRPKTCKSCGSGDLATKRLADLWSWSCRQCGASRTEKRC